MATGADGKCSLYWTDCCAHWNSMSGCLMDMLASGVRWVGMLAASSPTRPKGLFNIGRKSPAATGNKISFKNKSVTHPVALPAGQ